MKLILTQLALLLISTTAYTQKLIYQDLYLEPDSQVMDKRRGFDVYIYEDLKVFNGLGKAAKNFRIESSEGSVLFEFQQENSKASRFKPRFFSAGAEHPLIILLNLETSYSWGQHVILVDGTDIRNLGFIPVGADNFNFSDIGLYAQITAIEDTFLMAFPDDIKFIDYLTDEIISGSELKYKLDKSGVYRLSK